MEILPSHSERPARSPEELCPEPNGYCVIELRRANDGNLLAEIQESHAAVRKWLNAFTAHIPLKAYWTCTCAIDGASRVDQRVSANVVHLRGLNLQRDRHNLCRVVE